MTSHGTVDVNDDAVRQRWILYHERKVNTVITLVIRRGAVNVLPLFPVSCHLTDDILRNESSASALSVTSEASVQVYIEKDDFDLCSLTHELTDTTFHLRRQVGIVNNHVLALVDGLVDDLIPHF